MMIHFDAFNILPRIYGESAAGGYHVDAGWFEGELARKHQLAVVVPTCEAHHATVIITTVLRLVMSRYTDSRYPDCSVRDTDTVPT
jgi:hypothetical protein